MQKPFEETALKGVLQYINKFSLEEQEKLGLVSALFVSSGLASSSILNSLKKDHLIKEGISLEFFTKFLKYYLMTESIEHLSSSLKKGSTTDLAEFFPINKQSNLELQSHFKLNGLSGVFDFYTKQKSTAAQQETLYKLKELINDEQDLEEITAYLTSINKLNIITEPDLITIIWNGLLSSLDFNSKPDQIIDLVLKEISKIAVVLEEFCTKPMTEVTLINTIQVWAYENTKVMPAFNKILKVISFSPLVASYWFIYTRYCIPRTFCQIKQSFTGIQKVLNQKLDNTF